MSTFAKVVTRGGQEFYMTKGDDEQWYVMLLKSSNELQQSMRGLSKTRRRCARPSTI